MIFSLSTKEKKFLSSFSLKQISYFTLIFLLVGDLLSSISIKMTIIDHLHQTSPDKIANTISAFRPDLNQNILDQDFYLQLIKIYIQVTYIFITSLLLVNWFNYAFYFGRKKKWAFQYLKFLSSTGFLIAILGIFFDFYSFLGVINLLTAGTYFIIYRLLLFKEQVGNT